jgi:hypothetical protein
LNALPTDNFALSPVGARVFFFYEGYFSQSIIEACADALRMRLEAKNAATKTTRRLLGAFIELGQNIVHYSAESLTPEDAVDAEVRFGGLRVEEVDDRFVITCSNPVTAAGYERLARKLAVLVTMSLEEVKQHYREALRAEGDAESKGGGIGLLTLARDSSEPLIYSFDDIADRPSHKMFNLTVTV